MKTRMTNSRVSGASKTARSRGNRLQRGQVLVLAVTMVGVASMVVIACTMVGRTVVEKMVVQNAADAAAISAASVIADGMEKIAAINSRMGGEYAGLLKQCEGTRGYSDSKERLRELSALSQRLASELVARAIEEGKRVAAANSAHRAEIVISYVLTPDSRDSDLYRAQADEIAKGFVNNGGAGRASSSEKLRGLPGPLVVRGSFFKHDIRVSAFRRTGANWLRSQTQKGPAEFSAIARSGVGLVGKNGEIAMRMLGSQVGEFQGGWRDLFRGRWRARLLEDAWTTSDRRE